MNIPKRCNGQRPCSACATAGRECQYASDPFEAEAAAMKRKHDELKERMTEHENLYASLKTRDPHETDVILRRIRAGEDVKAVTGDTQGGSLTPQNIMISSQKKNPLIRNNSANTSNSTNTSSSTNTSNRANTSNSTSSPTRSDQRFSLGYIPQPQARLTSPYDHPGYIFEEAWRETQHRTTEDTIFVDLPGYALPLSRWTNVYHNDKLLSHLLLLFWTWDTVCNRIIDRSVFEEDLKNLDPNTTSTSSQLHFCSPFLVNALLAVSCLFSTNPATFASTGDVSTRGLTFAREAVRCLKFEDTQPSLPVAQGLALLYVYEAALGDGETALEFHSLMQSRYVALRLDDVQRSTDTAIAGSRQRAEAHALSWIQWGFYVWDWKPMHGLCRRLVIERPRRAKTWQDESNSQLNRKENPEYWWFPYPVSVMPQRSFKREIFDAECIFTEITEQILEFLIPLEQGYSPAMNAKRGLELYSKIMEFKFSLPENLKAENAVVPAAILLHLGIDLVAISMLQPFEDTPKEIFGPFEPRAMSYAHATNAMSTIWHFRALYTLRNEQWFVQACAVCAFRVLFAIETSPIQLETFIKACCALTELREAFPVAQQVIYSIETMVKKKRVGLPSYAKELLPNGAGEGVMESTDVKVRDHSVTVEKADSDGNEDRMIMSGLLSTLTPSEPGPD
ncbi:hypothetical protein NW762_012979 [Fusarium torreyae]|uniref:Xylanolytic transcriptional activator regulatory domain-containing protein n=1 Tax=Fusarium torreyae TaxID=1237075 RepID=A0A9W8RLE2_9HYPO|nr:hypothetical protein NW762_012979 [Fusarium torreyae]